MKKLIGVIGVILLWQSAAIYADNKILPTPTAVLLSLSADPRGLGIHCAYSVCRLAAGTLLAIAVGWPLGLMLGHFKKANLFFSPALYVAAPIPKIALLPIIMVLFGIGNASKIFVIFIIMVFQVIVTIRDAVVKIPAEYFMSSRAVRAPMAFIFRQIILPASVPGLFTALRLGLATGISVLFFAESFGTKWGVGFYVMDMWMRLDYERMYLGIIAFGLLGLVCAVLVDRLELVVCPWAKG